MDDKDFWDAMETDVLTNIDPELAQALDAHGNIRPEDRLYGERKQLAELVTRSTQPPEVADTIIRTQVQIEDALYPLLKRHGWHPTMGCPDDVTVAFAMINAFLAFCEENEEQFRGLTFDETSQTWI